MMKKTLVFILSYLLFLSCSKNDSNAVTACGCEQPQENLPWLKELIQKAKSDNTGNYWGYIWLEKFQGKDVFVTNMMLGSGGVAYWVFDCSGNLYVIGETEKYPASEFVGNNYVYLDEKDSEELITFLSSQMKKDVVIFSNVLSNDNTAVSIHR